jgi:broad specificity phosphatase PhoE
MTTARWPSQLWIVRHGESAGNVARDTANAGGAERIVLEARDVDIVLSPRGENQARALGAWFAAKCQKERPDVMLASPYMRAKATAQLFRDAGGTADSNEPICMDERLREKEFGILDGLTTAGVAALESWCDVIFRLRSLMDTVALHYAGRRVMIVAHQVVVLCLRYIIENMSEEQILAIDREGDVANCSVTEYRFDANIGRDGGLALVGYNITTPVAESAVAVTTEPEGTKAALG